jgi:HAD superfamily hydrolase (TIGR01509 family)
MKDKTIIWDIDGVLIWHHPGDPWKDWRKTLVENNLLSVWESFQSSQEWQLCITNCDVDTRECFEQFLNEKAIVLDYDIDKLLQIWLEKNVAPSLPALRKLYELRARGTECAIGSNQDALRKPHIERWLSRYDLSDLQRFISCDLKAAKPHASFYARVQENLGKQPEDIFLLDDLEENVKSAQKSGWQGILIDDSFRCDPKKWHSLSFIDVK